MRTISEEQFKKQFGEDAYNSFGSITPKKQSFLQDAVSDVKQIGTDFAETAIRRSEKVSGALEAGMKGEQGALRTTGQVIGQGAGFASDIIGDIFKGAVKAVLPQKAETGLKKGLEAVITPVMESQIAKNILQKYQSLDPKTKRDIEAALGIGTLAVDVATFGSGTKAGKIAVQQGIKAGERTVEAGVQLGKDLYASSRSATNKIISKVATPKPTTVEAVGEVLQGTTKDVKLGLKALSVLDTTNVKTYSELNKTILNKISDLSVKVDTDLAVDTTKRTLKELTVKATTTGGKVVRYNPVERALSHLKELYTSIGDDLAAKNIDELIATAKREGLTNLEINDIARVYGQEFGTKAFNKMDVPLTSVNAQLYENTRKSLKDLARQGIKGAEAKAADEAMSSLYRVQTLVKKNLEAVNKLQQKIRERGLLEKVGYNVVKYADVLTGGTLRSIMGGLLPRGVGYKVMNAIDIEKQLNSNLKIIQEALKSKSDAEVIRILGQLK